MVTDHYSSSGNKCMHGALLYLVAQLSGSSGICGERTLLFVMKICCFIGLIYSIKELTM